MRKVHLLSWRGNFFGGRTVLSLQVGVEKRFPNCRNRMGSEGMEPPVSSPSRRIRGKQEGNVEGDLNWRPSGSVSLSCVRVKTKKANDVKKKRELKASTELICERAWFLENKGVSSYELNVLQPRLRNSNLRRGRGYQRKAAAGRRTTRMGLKGHCFGPVKERIE